MFPCEGGAIERNTFWLASSIHEWLTRLNDPEEEEGKKVEEEEASSRASLLFPSIFSFARHCYVAISEKLSLQGHISYIHQIVV